LRKEICIFQLGELRVLDDYTLMTTNSVCT